MKHIKIHRNFIEFIHNYDIVLYTFLWIRKPLCGKWSLSNRFFSLTFYEHFATLKELDKALANKPAAGYKIHRENEYGFFEKYFKQPSMTFPKEQADALVKVLNKTKTGKYYSLRMDVDKGI